MRVFFDVVGHGAALKPAQAWMLRVPLHADRRTVLIHACVVGGIAAVVGLIVVGFLLGYAIWILQRISNLFRVNLYTRMQELSVRFHSEEKIGDAIFRMFQDSAAIPNVIDGLIVQPLIFIPVAIGSLLYLLWFDTRMALIVALLLPANFILAWMYANSLRAAFIGEREATALATTRIEETLASDQNRQSLRHRSSRSGELRARQLGRIPCRPPRAPDARALPRHDQHGSRSRLRCGAVCRRDGSDGGRNRGSRARRGFAGTVPGIDRAGCRASARAREISPTCGAACRTWSSRSRACSRCLVKRPSKASAAVMQSRRNPRPRSPSTT